MSGFLALFALSLPLLAPFLASDPILAAVSFLSLGLSCGPALMTLRSRGTCDTCQLERAGYAFRRLGVVQYFLGP